MSPTVQAGYSPTETLVDVPLRYLPESVMVDRLYELHSEVHSGARRYACADHVPTMPMNSTTLRVVDFMAMDCWKGRDGWPVHGFEIKASRGDWLSELRNPAKADAAHRYCDRWWLVVLDQRIVRDGELPGDWGLMVATKDGLTVLQRAKKLQPDPWPRPLVAAFARAVAKTARKQASA